jgi:hypothetical protein|tara:strand:- start:4798 stop:5055 length:258 start_codon:yes stop_codon:yes gene_type:complete
MAYQKLQAGRASAVTPSDTVEIASVTGGSNNGCVLFAGVGGDVRILTVGGDDVVLKNIANGQFIPVQVLKVFATNTTATNLVALW